MIRAIKNIEPGDEINYDYGTDYFKEYIKPIGCKCVACEKKRKKQRAEARAEKARLKAKAERKALKQAEKQAAKADKKKLRQVGACQWQAPERPRRKIRRGPNGEIRNFRESPRQATRGKPRVGLSAASA